MFNEIAVAVRFLLFSALCVCLLFAALVRGRFSFGRWSALSLLGFVVSVFVTVKIKKISPSIDHEPLAEVKQGVSISSRGRSHCCSLTF